MPAIDSPKSEWRDYFRGRLREIAPAERVTASAALCARLRLQPRWTEARCILFFHPLADEPDIWPLLMESVALGRQVALPRYSPTAGHYVPCHISGGAAGLQAGRYSILEPSPEAPALDPKQLDLALVPGIGFSFAGGRLGRGKGYYDRLLAEVPGFRCGVAFDCQVTAQLPTEPHDIRLNCILTPTRWHAVSDPPRS